MRIRKPEESPLPAASDAPLSLDSWPLALSSRAPARLWGCQPTRGLWRTPGSGVALTLGHVLLLPAPRAALSQTAGAVCTGS